MCTGRSSNQGALGPKSDALTTAPLCSPQKHYAAKEAYEAETAKCEAEELSKREELEIKERIECEKNDIEREKHDIEREKMEAAERQRKEEPEAAERHDQLLYDMEKAKLALEQGKIFEQLIVPKQYRELVIQLNHKSIFTGHLSVTSSVHKVLSE